MTNVYDLINDLYNSDEGWALFLSKDYAEGFIRREAFRGLKEEELYHVWTQIVVLCIYSGNSGIRIGDLTEDNFLDCIGWSGRNVAEFTADYENVEFFLTICDRFLKFLKSKNAITNDSAAINCKNKILSNGELKVFNEDGTLKDSYKNYVINANPDLPVKIFVNIGGKLDILIDEMREYFSKNIYKKDSERSSFLYFGIIPDLNKLEGYSSKEDIQCYWDYFLLDYKSIEKGKTLKSIFYEYYVQKYHSGSLHERSAIGLLEILLEARVAIFMVSKYLEEDDIYECQDFLTGEFYQVSLPIDGTFDYSETLFVGHILQDGTMVTNYVRCFKIGKSSQKRFYEFLVSAKNWYSIQKPEARDWHIFVEDNVMLLLHLALIYSGFFMMGSFVKETKIKNYTPAPIVLENPVGRNIMSLAKALSLPTRDRKLLIAMWSDFSFLYKEKIKDDEVTLWSVALIYSFIKLNKTYTFSLTDYARYAQITEDNIFAKIDIIEDVLKIEEYDPRYINEEGLIILMMS